MKLSASAVEATKEFIRTMVLGEIPVIVAALGVIQVGIKTDGTFDIKWMIVLAILAGESIGVLKTSLMSAADKWLHENDVKTPLDLKGMDTLKK